MIIAENGPLVQHANAIIEREMNSYWIEKKMSGWHFVRKSDSIKCYTGDNSKVIGRLMDTRLKPLFWGN